MHFLDSGLSIAGLIAILLTTVFAVVRLLFDTRSKQTGRLTTPGKAVLAGLIVSAFVSVLSLSLEVLKKLHDGKASAEQARELAENNTTTLKMLTTLTQQSHDTIAEIERAIFKIDKVTVRYEFTVPVHDDSFLSAYVDRVAPQRASSTLIVTRQDEFPLDNDPDERLARSLLLHTGLLLDFHESGQPSNGPGTGDLSVVCFGTSAATAPATVQCKISSETIVVTCQQPAPQVRFSGRILSARDLCNSQLLINLAAEIHDPSQRFHDSKELQGIRVDWVALQLGQIGVYMYHPEAKIKPPTWPLTLSEISTDEHAKRYAVTFPQTLDEILGL